MLGQKKGCAFLLGLLVRESCTLLLIVCFGLCRKT